MHFEPIIRKVAVFFEKHSNMLGHLASWHTVWRCSFFISDLIFSYSPPFGSLFLSQGGFFVKIMIGDPF
ncbi:hypothetical protein GMMP15_1930014 [Candidatus Magnetomoraceae bacterium gMMP-15]